MTISVLGWLLIILLVLIAMLICAMIVSAGRKAKREVRKSRSNGGVEKKGKNKKPKNSTTYEIRSSISPLVIDAQSISIQHDDAMQKNSNKNVGDIHQKQIEEDKRREQEAIQRAECLVTLYKLTEEHYAYLNAEPWEKWFIKHTLPLQKLIGRARAPEKCNPAYLYDYSADEFDMEFGNVGENGLALSGLGRKMLEEADFAAKFQGKEIEQLEDEAERLRWEIDRCKKNKEYQRMADAIGKRLAVIRGELQNGRHDEAAGFILRIPGIMRDYGILALFRDELSGRADAQDEFMRGRPGSLVYPGLFREENGSYRMYGDHRGSYIPQ